MGYVASLYPLSQVLFCGQDCWVRRGRHGAAERLTLEYFLFLFTKVLELNP